MNFCFLRPWEVVLFPLIPWQPAASIFTAHSTSNFGRGAKLQQLTPPILLSLTSKLPHIAAATAAATAAAALSVIIPLLFWVRESRSEHRRVGYGREIEKITAVDLLQRAILRGGTSCESTVIEYICILKSKQKRDWILVQCAVHFVPSLLIVLPGNVPFKTAACDIHV